MYNRFTSTLSIVKLYIDNFLKNRRKKIFMKKVGLDAMQLVPIEEARDAFALVGQLHQPSTTLVSVLGVRGIEISFMDGAGERVIYTKNSFNVFDTFTSMLTWMSSQDKRPYDIDDWSTAISVYSKTGSYLVFEGRHYIY